ncbi:hypothetical protein CBR_g39718 [Chara braunii]|uniref:Uncharacterized protein n=1 Tax=Chara braunii TaxID=69332 RepID=A0A388LSI0_CHABU|nr:hypothetical protein CBR_g39718 [Chara braunii]|eukprot:GBG85152.1 hypothetical protein CBR_g39718 [Chara braunii]
MREFCATVLHEKIEEKEKREEEEERRKQEGEQRVLGEEREKREQEKHRRTEERDARLALLIGSKLGNKDQGYQVIVEQMAEQNKLLKQATDEMKGGTVKNSMIIMVEDMRRDLLLLHEVKLEHGRKKRAKEPCIDEGTDNKSPANKLQNLKTPEREARLAQKMLEMQMKYHEEMKAMRAQIKKLQVAQASQMNTSALDTPSMSRGVGRTPMTRIWTVGPNELFAKTTPNPIRRAAMISRVMRSGSDGEEIREPLGFDRLIPGKKTVVAEPGEQGRKKYVDDTKRFLRTKNVSFFTKMAKDEKVKAKSNRKEDLVDALTEARTVIAYGKRMGSSTNPNLRAHQSRGPREQG